MVRPSALAFALLAAEVVGCGGAVGEDVVVCPSVRAIEHRVELQTHAVAAELTLAQLPRLDLFPAVGAGSPWGIERVELELRTREPLDVVLSRTSRLEGEPVVLGRVDAGGGVVSITGPTPPGHLLLVRPRDPGALPEARTPLHVAADVRIGLGAPTCMPLVARLRSVRPVCANGRLEPGEACDDGNAEAGDGCHACRLEPPTCDSGAEGQEAFRPWACVGEPSRCAPIDCAVEIDPRCRQQVRVDVVTTVQGRTGDEILVHVTGDVPCPATPEGEEACTTEWPVCTPMTVHAAVDDGASFDGWLGACESSEASCTMAGAAVDVSLVASATAEQSGIDWLSTIAVDAEDVHAAVGPGGAIAVALATTIPSVTTPEAGGFVHRRATRLLLYGPEGRLRFDRRVGGRAEHVQPRAVAALGDGGVLLVAAFPQDFPILAPDVRPTRNRAREAPRQPRVILRLVRFSPGGDPVWVEDLGDDGVASITLVEAHAWVGVARAVDVKRTAYDSEVFDVDPSGRRRWSTNLPGWRLVDLAPDGSAVRVLGRSRAGALETMAIDATGEASVPTRVRGAAPPSLGAGVGEDVVVQAHAVTREEGQVETVVVRATGGTGAERWEHRLTSPHACDTPLVSVDAVGETTVLLPSCEIDGSPSGFTVDHFASDGRLHWRQRLGGPGSGARGIRPLAMHVDDTGHVIVTGRSDRPAALGEHVLGEAQRPHVFVLRLLPNDT